MNTFLAKNQKTVLKNTMAFIQRMNKVMPMQVGENFHAEGRGKFQSCAAVFSHCCSFLERNLRPFQELSPLFPSLSVDSLT